MLGSNGLLVPGRHQVTLEQMRTHFVDAFPTSKTRAPLFLRWLQHRQALGAVLPILSQWVDGSYVTDKPDPADVDVVTLLDGPTLDGLDSGQRALLLPLTDGAVTRTIWGVDSYILPVYPDGHPLKSPAKRQEGYWVNLWSQVRGQPTASKGFLEVT